MHSLSRPWTTISLCFVFILAFQLHAQTDVLTPYNIFSIKMVAEAAVSPDGKHIAYTVNVPRPFYDAPGNDYRELFVWNIATNTTRPFITGKKSFGAIGWTPDSKHITFAGNLGDVTGSQVYIMPIDGGAPMPVTSGNLSVMSYSYSPDGTTIAFSSTPESETRKKNLTAKGFNAEIYEEDWQHRNLYLYSIGSKESRQLTRDVSVFDFVWSADGKTIAAAVAPRNLVDDSYMFKRIHAIDVVSGTMTKLVDNPGKLGAMKFSPDGKNLAFISAEDVHDNKEGRIVVAPVPNTNPFEQLKNYSKGFEGHVIALDWKDNNTLLYTSEEGVDITLREQKLTEDKGRLVIKPGTVAFSNFSKTGDLLAFTAHTPSHPNELYTVNLKNNKLTRITTTNEWLKNVRLSRQEEFRYKAKDGLEITSILIYPLNYEKGKRYPLITYIHGGPEAANQNGWLTGYGSWGQIAAAKDYFVFYPNYRASTGRGVEFARMGLGDLAGKEFEDVLDGIDALIAQGMVDKSKVGIGGGSYGGYFSGWAATRHSDRFAAAVSFVGVSNQISKRNTTDIPYEDYYVHWGIWTHEDYEKVYDRSPVKWAQNSTTPTLILHGKEDPRVHPSQSLELYRSLKVHGKAPVRLVWYPGEGHGNRRNPARLDFAIRTMEWFDYYLKSDKPKDKMPAAEIEYEVE